MPIAAVVVTTTWTHAPRRSAVDELYRRYRPDVFSLACREVGSRSDADDVTQTTFLLAHKALREGVTPENERAWLLAIARNVCRSRFRSLSRRPQEVPLDETLSASGEEGATSQQLVEALRAVPPRQRLALVLQAVGGYSSAEIGKRLGLRTGAAEGLLHRARTSLRANLEGAGPLPCEATEELVLAQLRRAIGDDDRDALRAHLRSCRACATAARKLRARRGAGLVVLLPWDVARRLARTVGRGGATLAAVVLAVATIGTIAALQGDSRPSSGGRDEARRPAASQRPAGAGGELALPRPGAVASGKRRQGAAERRVVVLPVPVARDSSGPAGPRSHGGQPPTAGPGSLRRSGAAFAAPRPGPATPPSPAGAREPSAPATSTPGPRANGSSAQPATPARGGLGAEVTVRSGLLDANARVVADPSATAPPDATVATAAGAVAQSGPSASITVSGADGVPGAGATGIPGTQAVDVTADPLAAAVPKPSP